MTVLSSVIQGSAIVNSIFALLYGIGKWISSRLQDSKCKSNNSCFQCESNLTHLQTIRQTNDLQLVQLENLAKEIKELKKESQSFISLN